MIKIPSAGGAYIFNNQASEFIYVGSGGTHDIDPSPMPEDRIFDVYLPEVMSYSDYYPFLMKMPGRYDNADGYRYNGANGQESQTEITGGNSHSTAEYWMYDGRLGRRWNVDPIMKPHESPYATYANNPVKYLDPNGADTVTVNADATHETTKGGDDALFLYKQKGEVSKKAYDAYKAVESFKDSWLFRTLFYRRISKNAEFKKLGITAENIDKFQFSVNKDGSAGVFKKSQVTDLDGFKDYIATVAAEASNNTDEAQGISEILLKRLEHEKMKTFNVSENGMKKINKKGTLYGRETDTYSEIKV